MGEPTPGRTEYRVENPDWDYNELTVWAETPLDAAEQAVQAWSVDKDVTYDGEEIDVRVRPTAGGKWMYFRGAATVLITWEVAATGQEEDEP